LGKTVASIKVEDLDEQEPLQESPQAVEERVEEPVISDLIVEVKKKRTAKLPLIITLVILIALGAGFAWALKDRNRLKNDVNKQTDQSQVIAPDESKQLNTEVSQLVVLPTDEIPSIATVADATKLKQQSSGFENAQNGDKLLIYAKAKQIIVYRPSVKKVVSIVQIALGQSTPTPGTTQKKQ
jgi:uncharacterized protein HemX